MHCLSYKPILNFVQRLLKDRFILTFILPIKCIVSIKDACYKPNRVKVDSSEKNVHRVRVRSDGAVTWLVPAIIESSCPLDVTSFPWDSQSCVLQVGSWAHDGDLLDIHPKSNSGDTTFYVPNGAWRLLGFPTKKQMDYYSCCPEPFPSLHYKILLERRPLYTTITVIVPCAIIGSLVVLVFLLPAQSGEKLSMAVTVLLATTVFMLLVAENMPEQSMVIPLICKYAGYYIVYVAGS